VYILRFFTINTISELICFLIATVCLIQDKTPVWRWMIIFLFITCVTEMLGIYVKKLYLADRLHVHPNAWLYNILLVFQASFICLMFNSILNKYGKSKLIFFTGFALLSVIYIYEAITEGIFIYHNLTNTVMSVLFVLYSLYYFYQLLKDDAYINLSYSPGFWWVTGLLFFYFGSTACNIFFDSLSPEHSNSLKHLSAHIFKTLNILLYSCWSYSFICKKWQRQTSVV
jgi:hypothetical protein